MTFTDTMSALAKHPFLSDLPEQHLQTLAAVTRKITVTAGQYLGREKETADAFYLIQSGRVAIELRGPEGKTFRIQTLCAGEIVGWSWLVPPHCWQFDARVADNLQALAIDARSLREKCEHDHDLGYCVLRHLVEVVAGRLAATRKQLIEGWK